MDILRDADIDPAPLAGKRVAILGYGNQGCAQALNLHDSGVDVVVGLRGGSGSAFEAEAAGLTTALIEDAVGSADLVMMLAPDEMHGALYREIEPYLRSGAALGFSHGLSVRFGFVDTKMAKSRFKPFMISREAAAEVIVRTLRGGPRRVTFPLRMAWLVAVLRCVQGLKRLLSR